MSGAEGENVPDELPDINAGRVALRVVAAKKPGQWIVRAMAPFAGFDSLRESAQRYVGVLDRDLQWSSHKYDGWPGYVVYGEGDLVRLGVPTGVFMFDYKNGDPELGTDRYGPARRLGDVR